MSLDLKISELRELCKKNGVKFLGLFGSVARGEETRESDIDFLVKFREPVGLIKLLSLENSFMDILNRKVDLATEGSLHAEVLNTAFSDMKILYEEQ